MLSNNNLSSVKPKLLAEAIVQLKDVDLRSSLLTAEQVADGLTIYNARLIFSVFKSSLLS